MYAPPLLIMNVQVCSPDMNFRYLTSKEGILKYECHSEIKIPVSNATTVNGGPIVGKRYCIRYLDGIEQDICPPELFYIGIADNQFVFSSAVCEPTCP